MSQIVVAWVVVVGMVAVAVIIWGPIIFTLSFSFRRHRRCCFSVRCRYRLHLCRRHSRIFKFTHLICRWINVIWNDFIILFCLFSLKTSYLASSKCLFMWQNTLIHPKPLFSLSLARPSCALRERFSFRFWFSAQRRLIRPFQLVFPSNLSNKPLTFTLQNFQFKIMQRWQENQVGNHFSESSSRYVALILVLLKTIPPLQWLNKKSWGEKVLRWSEFDGRLTQSFDVKWLVGILYEMCKAGKRSSRANFICICC